MTRTSDAGGTPTRGSPRPPPQGIDLVRKDVRGMKGYDEEFVGALNMAANTNLFGPNPALQHALSKVRADRLVDYPSLTSAGLREAVARKLGVAPTGVITGNGSNELIDIVLRTFLDPGDRVAYHWPTFSMIPIFTKQNHGVGVAVPLDADWNLDPGAMLDAAAKVTFIVRPNNPTGNAFPRRDVERVVSESRGLVVIDEAYVEFMGGESFVKEVREGNDRLVVLRTLSKAYGMAGLRVGYGVAHDSIAHEISKVRGPYRLDHLAETAASMALGDDKHLDATVDAVRQERANLKRVLEERGFVVYRTDANFFLTKPPVDANRLAAGLAQHGVVTRDFGGELKEYLRITVGPPSATAKLRLALDDVLAKLRGGAE